MPFLFIIVGLVMVTAAARNTVSDSGNDLGLTHLFKNDFVGKNNFIYWTVSILLIGAIGYIKPLQPISRMFLALVVVVLLLTNKGVFSQFNAALNLTQKSQTKAGTP